MAKFLLLAMVALGGCTSLIGMDRYIRDDVTSLRQMHDYEMCGGALPGNEKHQDRCMAQRGYRVVTP